MLQRCKDSGCDIGFTGAKNPRLQRSDRGKGTFPLLPAVSTVDTTGILAPQKGAVSFQKETEGWTVVEYINEYIWYNVYVYKNIYYLYCVMLGRYKTTIWLVFFSNLCAYSTCTCLLAKNSLLHRGWDEMERHFFCWQCLSQNPFKIQVYLMIIPVRPTHTSAGVHCACVLVILLHVSMTLLLIEPRVPFWISISNVEKSCRI